MVFDPKQALFSAAGYVREHPDELLRALRLALRFRLGVPVAALRYLASAFESPRGPHHICLESRPPGLYIEASVEEMDTPLRASCTVVVERIKLGTGEFKIELRLNGVTLRVESDTIQTPIAALVRSGALDLSRVANLVAHMPAKPAILVEAVDDRLVLDLMRLPRLASDERLRRLVGIVAALLTIEAVETDSLHLDVAFRPFPNGVPHL